MWVVMFDQALRLARLWCFSGRGGWFSGGMCRFSGRDGVEPPGQARKPQPGTEVKDACFYSG